jgi:hypothetical protein
MPSVKPRPTAGRSLLKGLLSLVTLLLTMLMYSTYKLGPTFGNSVLSNLW